MLKRLYVRYHCTQECPVTHSDNDSVWITPPQEIKIEPCTSEGTQHNYNVHVHVCTMYIYMYMTSMALCVLSADDCTYLWSSPSFLWILVGRELIVSLLRPCGCAGPSLSACSSRSCGEQQGRERISPPM